MRLAPLTLELLMHVRARKTAIATTLGLLLLAPTTVGGPQPASAAGTDIQLTRGDVRSDDGMFHLVYNAKVAKGQPDTAATGFFSGQAMSNGTQVVDFSGPITCLHVSGTSVGFFYPITKSDPAAVQMFGAAVFIYVDTDGLGNATAFTFVSSPTATTDSCAPLAGTTAAGGPAFNYAGPTPTLSGPARVYPVLGKPVTLSGTAAPGIAVQLLMRSTGEPGYVVRRTVRTNAAGVYPLRGSVRVAANGTWSHAFKANQSYDFFVSRTAGAAPVALYRFKAV